MKNLLEKGTNIFHSLHWYSAHSSRTTRKGMEEEQGGIKKLFTLFVLIPHLGVLADKQCEAGEFLTPEKTLKNHNFRSVPVGSPLDCHLLCKKDPKCQSYNFVVSGNICELNNSTKEASPRDLVRDDARFYMGMKHAEGQRPQTFASCRDIYRESRTEVNGNYLLQMPSGNVSVYCHMSSQGLGSCSGGGWTLVMKIDGRKQTRRGKPIQQKQKAGIVTSLNDTTLTKVTYGKYDTWVPDEVAYGIYEWFREYDMMLSHHMSSSMQARIICPLTVRYLTCVKIENLAMYICHKFQSAKIGISSFTFKEAKTVAGRSWN
ncbi:uncharacterized protein LOC141889509 isoform X3 [Acropora palmata]|uniref:uncharacterized protein LOC141889509 isoform X3 n=1 Tax=Acropora palmata TaxID=6131 RepID=UPI003DA035D5